MDSSPWTTGHHDPVGDPFALSLDVRFEEIRGPADMDGLLNRMEGREQATLAALRGEFGADTDAATVLRVNRQPWEPAYLAVINCEGWHEFRRYFSKWHELAHRLLEGSQLTFVLRQTKVERMEPEEVLVDKVAAALAFFAVAYTQLPTPDWERALADMDRHIELFRGRDSEAYKMRAWIHDSLGNHEAAEQDRQLAR